jgi:uncharacterized membrane protein (DUF106 family)
MADLAEQKVMADRERTRKRLVRTVVFLLSVLVVAGIIIGIILNKARQEAIADKMRAEKLRLEADDQTRKARAQKVLADRATLQAVAAAKLAREAESARSFR